MIFIEITIDYNDSKTKSSTLGFGSRSEKNLEAIAQNAQQAFCNENEVITENHLISYLSWNIANGLRAGKQSEFMESEINKDSQISKKLMQLNIKKLNISIIIDRKPKTNFEFLSQTKPN